MKKTIVLVTKTGLTIELRCEKYDIEYRNDLYIVKLFNEQKEHIGSFYEVQGWYEEAGLSNVPFDSRKANA